MTPSGEIPSPSLTSTPTPTPTPTSTATDCYLWDQIDCSDGSVVGSRYIHATHGCSGLVSAGCITLNTFIRCEVVTDGVNCNGTVVIMKVTSTTTVTAVPTGKFIDGSEQFSTYTRACDNELGQNC